MEKSSDCRRIICPKFEQTFGILGKKWSGLIIEVLLAGPQRFKEIAGTIPEVSDRVLVVRLRELEAAGLVEKIAAKEGGSKSLYSLTEKGAALQPVMQEVQIWAEKWV